LNVRTFLARPDGGPRSQNISNDITGNGTYTLAGNASCGASVPFLGAVSRKTHGNAGTFDVGLPLTGKSGIECRTGGPNGNFTVVFTFANPIVSVGSVTFTGTGSVSSRTIGSDPHEYIVNLTGVTNAQRLTVTLNNVTDTVGNASASIAAPMGVLLGDTNADAFTDAVDVSQTKSQSGKAITNSNFREDVNADGFIDAIDTSLVKSKSGTALP
jgi:hypothetical protein